VVFHQIISKRFSFTIMMKRYFVFLVFAFIPLHAYSQLEGKAIGISDGDTFTLLVDKETIKIRLHGIDCPEKSQDFGSAAKTFLSDLIFGKMVSVKTMNKDRYGRTIAIVTIDGRNVNEELLKAGLAWHFKRYDKNAVWAQLEEKAREEKKGLWVMPNPIPPWECRKVKKAN
jgi:micrococcal nuclease